MFIWAHQSLRSCIHKYGLGRWKRVKKHLCRNRDSPWEDTWVEDSCFGHASASGVCRRPKNLNRSWNNFLKETGLKDLLVEECHIGTGHCTATKERLWLLIQGHISVWLVLYFWLLSKGLLLFQNICLPYLCYFWIFGILKYYLSKLIWAIKVKRLNHCPTYFWSTINQSPNPKKCDASPLSHLGATYNCLEVRWYLVYVPWKFQSIRMICVDV